MKRGYGDLIAKARDSRGLTVEQLAERLGRSVSTIRRLENERTEPSVEQINALVAALPISTEELLRAMGVHLSPPAAARLPRDLIEALLEMSPEQHRALLDFVRPLPPATNGSRR